MEVARYLDRIAYDGPLEPTAATLAGLHEAHYRTVPFENLDIALGRPIVPVEATCYAKIVDRRRGGFCYELNCAFAWLLRALGFQVTLHSAEVWEGESGGFSPPFDHLALRVNVGGSWLADVGFGAAFFRPLRLDERGEQHDPGGVFRVIEAGAWLRLESRDADGAWRPAYRFGLSPYALADFAARCRYHQASPDSHFTQHSTCSLPTATGRVTLSDRRLIVTANGLREETDLPDEAARAAALKEHFGIVL